MKTFSQMKSSVGTNCQDTSSSFGTKIGTKLNQRGRDIWNRCMWTEKFNADYTFTAIVGTSEYSLLGDFMEEVSVHDITVGRKLDRMTIGQLWEERGYKYEAGSVGNGMPVKYAITDETDGGTLQVKLDPPPDATDTYAMPYMRKYTDLLGTTGTCTTDTASKIIASASAFITDGVESGMRVKNTTDGTYGFITSVDSETQLTMDRDLCPDGDENFTIAAEFLVRDIDWIAELGATGDALMLKRRPPEAGVYYQMYELELRRKIGQFKANNNQLSQFIPSQRSTSTTYAPNFGDGSNYPV